jgi:hypothetical protein
VRPLAAATDGEQVTVLDVVVLLRRELRERGPDPGDEVRAGDVQPARPSGQADAGLHEILVCDLGQMGEVTAEKQLAVAVVGVQDLAHDCLQGALTG